MAIGESFNSNEVRSTDRDVSGPRPDGGGSPGITPPPPKLQHTAVVYVAKVGNDANTGLNGEEPKLTIGAALTVAESIKAANGGCSVLIMDGGIYTENITVGTTVHVYGEGATLRGTITMNKNASVKLFWHEATANSQIMLDKTGDGPSEYDVVVSDSRPGVFTTVTNIRNITNNSILFVNVQKIFVGQFGRGIQDFAAVKGHIHFKCKDIYLAANTSIGIDMSGAGSDSYGFVDHILNFAGTETGTTAITLGNAGSKCHVVCTQIDASTAYNCTLGTLYLVCPEIKGTRTGTPVFEVSEATWPPNVLDLRDTLALTPTDGQVLTWNQSLARWIPADSAAGPGPGPSPGPSPFTPLSLEGCALWLDASDPATLFDATSGGSPAALDSPVARWEDKSGNDRHFIGATAANRPERKTESESGVDMLLFDGVENMMEAHVDQVIPQPYTIVAVFKASSFTGGINYRIFNAQESPASDANTVLVGLRNSPDQMFIAAGTEFNFANLDTRINSLIARFNFRQSSVNFNEAELRGDANNRALERTWSVGSRYAADRSFHGYIAEVIIYDRRLSAYETDQLNLYIKDKYHQPFTPLNLPNCALWLDADDPATLFDAVSGGSPVAADGQVARWEDKSGNNFHLTQGTAASRPIRKIGVRNGRDVLDFDGSNDALERGTTNILRNVAGGTMFMVSYLRGLPTSPNARTLLRVFTSGSNVRMTLDATDSSGAKHRLGTRRVQADSFYSVQSTVPYLMDDYIVTTGVVNYTTRDVLLRVDGIERASGTASWSAGNTEDLDSTTVDIGNVLSNNAPDAIVCEAIVYERALSENECILVEQYLMRKWVKPEWYPLEVEAPGQGRMYDRPSDPDGIAFPYVRNLATYNLTPERILSDRERILAGGSYNATIYFPVTAFSSMGYTAVFRKRVWLDSTVVMCLDIASYLSTAGASIGAGNGAWTTGFRISPTQIVLYGFTGSAFTTLSTISSISIPSPVWLAINRSGTNYTQWRYFISGNGYTWTRLHSGVLNWTPPDIKPISYLNINAAVWSGTSSSTISWRYVDVLRNTGPDIDRP